MDWVNTEKVDIVVISCTTCALKFQTKHDLSATITKSFLLLKPNLTLDSGLGLGSAVIFFVINEVLHAFKKYVSPQHNDYVHHGCTLVA